MVMIGQHRRLSEPLRWTRRTKIAAIGAAFGLLAAIAAAVALALVNAHPRRAGCIEVTFASTLGGAVTHACGAHARELCATPNESPALAAGGALREACREAKLRYGGG